MHVTEVSVERLKVTGRLTVALLRSILFVLEQGADRPGVSVEEVSPARGSVVAQNAGSPARALGLRSEAFDRPATPSCHRRLLDDVSSTCFNGSCWLPGCITEQCRSLYPDIPK